MRHELVPEWTRQQVETAFQRADPDELRHAVLSAALTWDDTAAAEAVCLRLVEHPDPNVRGNAVLGLGHIARRFGHLSPKGVGVVETARSDTAVCVRGQAEAASDDLNTFASGVMNRDSFQDEPFEPFVAGAWTFVQVVFYLFVFEIALILVSVSHDWRPNLGRGILWYTYHFCFVVLALLANLALQIPRVAASLPMRLTVWGVLMAVLSAFSWPTWPALPLAVPFVHACALVAIWVREEAGWYVSRRRARTLPNR